MDAWRLVIDGDLEATVNMARDRAIQLEVEAGASPPTLRLYGWARPTVTLGRFQDLASVDVEACARHGVDVVRRFTGGRGVLHDREVTYAVIARVADGVPRGVAQSYRFLSAGLLGAYERLGVAAVLTSGADGDRGSGACYLQNTRADLSAGAAKLSGSAQVWHGETVLQHGSFVLDRDVALEAEVFRLDSEQAVRLAEKTVTLKQLCSVTPGVDAVRDAVVNSFEALTGRPLRPQALTTGERELEAQLIDAVKIDVRP